MEQTSVGKASGTWRESDETAVDFDVAKAAWSVAARDVLMNTASRYHAYITYGELAEAIQQMSGIRTRSQMRNWITSVLTVVVDDCRRRGEPPLTALCVRQDQTIGEGYAYALQASGEDKPQDLDLHAAAARLTCYRYFGAQVPTNGGYPSLPPKLAAKRARAAAQNVVPAALCPRCFIQLPSRGRCDNCD